jgi:hypothetical protein
MTCETAVRAWVTAVSRYPFCCPGDGFWYFSGILARAPMTDDSRRYIDNQFFARYQRIESSIGYELRTDVYMETGSGVPRGKFRCTYRGFKPKPGGILSYNIIVVPNQR